MVSSDPNPDSQKEGILTEDNILEYSEYWPLRVSLLPDSDLNLGGGFPAILLRVEPEGFALLDFGREGQHKVAISKTDLLERAYQISQGNQKKDYPNFVAYSFNVFVRYLVPFEPLPLVAPEVLVESDYLILFYPDSAFLEDVSVVNDFKILEKQALELNSQILFVPTSLKFYQGLEESSLRNINIATHFSFLAYLKSFGHNPGKGLTVAIIDPEGRLFKRFEAEEQKHYKDLFKEISAFIDRIK